MTVIDEFEKEFKKFTGAKYAIACCNGTAALHTALLSINIGRGDGVITTPFSFIASSNAILYCGAEPIFADINPINYCIEPLEIRKNITKRAAAILPVHLFGKSCTIDTIMDIAEKNYLRVIEDCSQALGVQYNGQHVGTFGDMGTFSFYASKNLWTFEGGMIITNNDFLAEKARLLINHGQDRKYHHILLGYNYRMPENCALIGLTMLKLHKKGIQAELGSYGLENGNYPEVIYNQPIYKQLGIKGNCPIAEKIARDVKSKYEIQ